jgi:DNA repair protein SbcD/Mre11
MTDTIRYSGSPLAYSFSEARHRKGSWLVELDAAGMRSAEFVDAPVPRPLARIKGELHTLLSDPALAEHESAWVQATLTDDTRPLQAMDQLRRRFPHTLVLAFEPAHSHESSVPTSRTHGRTDHEIALGFVADLRRAPATEAESAVLLQACDACCEDPDFDVMLSTGPG